MKLLPRILNRIAFVRAEYAADGSCRTEVFAWRAASLSPADRTGGEKHPRRAGRLRAWCRYETRRRADYGARQGRSRDFPVELGERPDLLRASGAARCTDRRTCGGRDRSGAHLLRRCRGGFRADGGGTRRQLYAGLRWRSLLRPTPESSAAAQAGCAPCGASGAGAAALPAYGERPAFAAMNARRQALKAELAARERSASNAASSGSRQRELLAEFSKRPGCTAGRRMRPDRRAVPERVVLTQLAVEPLTKRFEARQTAATARGHRGRQRRGSGRGRMSRPSCSGCRS